MKIGILGAGSVGSTLGRRWAEAGHGVAYGSRNPGSEEMKALGAVSLAAAAAASNVVVLATPWAGAQEAIQAAGPLAGKILIDATNPLKPKLDGLELGTTTSAGEQVAGWAEGALVVKAFNTVGYNIMANPRFNQAGAVMFYCGDDAGAKNTVRQLVTDLGFDAVDAGPLTQSRLLEPFALLWISLAYQAGLGREIGFQLMRR
jgi:8-hydroxy-5-deazaflavin:NADPH oxidoreductase